MTALERAAMRRNTEAVTTATHVRDEDGIVRTRGTKHLKQTQAYPMSFGAFHGRLFHEFFLTVGRVAMGPQPEYDPTAVAVDEAGCFRDFDEGIPWDSRPAKEHSVPLS